MESNLILAVPPWASTLLISSTKSGASLIIIAKASGLLPGISEKLSSTAAEEAAVAVVGPERLRGLEEPPPMERRLALVGRWGGGGGKEEERRLGPPPPPPRPPPRPPSLDGPPYIGESV